MLCDILRDFPFSRDGVTVETAIGGAQIDLPDDIAPGLVAEGYASEVVAKAPSPKSPKAAKPAPEG